jgi:hypothetical protein
MIKVKVRKTGSVMTVTRVPSVGVKIGAFTAPHRSGYTRQHQAPAIKAGWSTVSREEGWPV